MPSWKIDDIVMLAWGRSGAYLIFACVQIFSQVIQNLFKCQKKLDIFGVFKKGYFLVFCFVLWCKKIWIQKSCWCEINDKYRYGPAQRCMWTGLLMFMQDISVHIPCAVHTVQQCIHPVQYCATMCIPCARYFYAYTLCNTVHTMCKVCLCVYPVQPAHSCKQTWEEISR